MFGDSEQIQFIPEVYIKLTCPQIPYDSFADLMKAHPECSVDAIASGEYVRYKCMNRADWEIWMQTGVMPVGMWVV